MIKPYMVLARKWRPQQFSDIVGQSHIVHTLFNAIRTERLHQAYLFTGSRGVGKTSIARILAKAIRCEKKQTLPEGIKTCDECQSCKEITTSTSIDVLEIDGASNNGVDSIREIRESAQYMPSYGSKKIYIIDEVHMLSTAAFNALLKILEEPPSHVIFIFATTEPHKIPATILSRCQRFDYKRVSLPQIQARLDYIIQAEGLKSEASALSLIARTAEGSMRDALSLLDQVIAYCGAYDNPSLSVTQKFAQESLGVISEEINIKILKGIFQRTPEIILESVESIYQQGHDFRLLTRSLMELIHASIILKINVPLSNSIQVSQEGQKELQSIISSRTLEEMEFIFQVFHHGIEWISKSPQPKIVFDILCIKCASADILKNIGPKGGTQSPNQQLPGKESSEKSSSPHQMTQEQNSLPKNLISTPTIPVDLSNQSNVQPVIPIEKIKSLDSEKFIQYVKEARPLLGSILEHSNGIKLQDEAIIFYFTPEEAYFKEQIQSRIYQEQLSLLSRNYFGRSIRIFVEFKSEGESLITKKEKETQQKIQLHKHQAETHPIIQEAKSLFGGILSPIQLKVNAEIETEN